MHDILTNVINRRTYRILCGAGADFKREFTLSSYEQFFKDADYTDAEYIWWLCYTKKHDFRAASVFLRV